MTKRSLIKTFRTPEQLADVTIQPIIFVLVFVYLLGGAIAGNTHDYLEFLLPAIMVQNVMFASVATGLQLNTDIEKGVFDRFRSLPIGRSVPLIGGVVGDLVRYVVSIVILIAFGSVLGFRVQTSPWEVIAACLLVILFAMCLSWIFVLLGMVLRTPGSVQGLSFAIMFPLTFGSNLLVQTTTLPGWLQAWVKVNPVSQVMAASRALLVGAGSATRPVLWTLLSCAVVLVVFVPLAVAAYRRRA